MNMEVNEREVKADTLVSRLNNQMAIILGLEVRCLADIPEGTQIYRFAAWKTGLWRYHLLDWLPTGDN